MASKANGKKLHTFSRTERLRNFSLIKLLFTKGEVFHAYPFRVVFMKIDQNLEKLFFADNGNIWASLPELQDSVRQVQNPSYPHWVVPENALFYHPVKTLITVSSKAQKKAVVRNHLKRLTREVYRQNKASLYPLVDNAGIYCLLAFIYTAREVVTYSVIEQKIILSLQKIEQSIKESNT